MKAKDTVMTYEQNRVILDEMEPLETCEKMDLLRTELEAQAEISFKARMKEVVDWVNNCSLRGKNSFSTGIFTEDDIPICKDWWWAKLKEWGIKKEVDSDALPRTVINLWNGGYLVEDIVGILGIVEDYIEMVIENTGNYKEV